VDGEFGRFSPASIMRCRFTSLLCSHNRIRTPALSSSWRVMSSMSVRARTSAIPFRWSKSKYVRCAVIGYVCQACNVSFPDLQASPAGPAAPPAASQNSFNQPSPYAPKVATPPAASQSAVPFANAANRSAPAGSASFAWRGAGGAAKPVAAAPSAYNLYVLVA